MSAGDDPPRIDEALAEARALLPRRPGAADLPALRARRALIVDIRPIEQRARDGEMAGALVVDRNVLEWRLDPTSPHRIPEAADPDQEIVVLCNEGYASSLAALSLQRLGLRRATDLDGGFRAVKAGEHRSVASAPSFTVGVEEEYLIADSATGELRSRAGVVLPAARAALGDQVQPELSRSQIEVGTPVCQTLGDVRGELGRLRAEVIAAARLAGSWVAAAGSHPDADWREQTTTPKDRYLELDRTFRLLAWELLICGCHVHVAVEDPEAAISVIDRCRPWLPTLLALSANSPFWQGLDTGYCSYRTQVFDRLPVTGAPPVLGSRSAYDRLVEALVATGSMADPTRLYWDVRPSVRFPTVEFRICDVGLTVDDDVMAAGLIRALVRTCHAQAVAGQPVPPVHPEVVRSARWRASRDGLDGELVDLGAGCTRPAAAVVESLLTFVRPDLEDAGEWDEVSGLVAQTLRRGNGARRQREVYGRTGSFAALVEWMADQTALPSASTGPAARFLV